MRIAKPGTLGRTLQLVAAMVVAALSACQHPASKEQAPPKYMAVNGTQLPYAEQGRGEPVVFVHGALSDYRTWDRHRDILATRYRAVSYTQRYFGSGAWESGGPVFGVQTHSDDLAAFIRALQAGPVHLVGWSYGASVVLNVAVKHPELVRSAFVYEPPIPTFVADPTVIKSVMDDVSRSGIPQAAQAAKDGAFERATELMIDAVSERAGYFASQPAAYRAIQLDSARTLRAQLVDQPRPPPVSCEQLGQLRPPVAIVRGEKVRPMLKIVADEAARCAAGKRHVVVPNQKHMWPLEDQQGFSEAAMAFLKDK